MPPWAVQLFSEVRSLREALDAHVTTFREEQGRWESKWSITTQLMTTVNLTRDGLQARMWTSEISLIFRFIDMFMTFLLFILCVHV
jgi:hypothetical protein